jgi:hypothetical protein
MKRTLFAAAVATLALGTASVYAADADVPQPSVSFDHQMSSNIDRNAEQNADRTADRANDAAETHRQSAAAGSSSSAARNDSDSTPTLNATFNYPY